MYTNLLMWLTLGTFFNLTLYGCAPPAKEQDKKISLTEFANTETEASASSEMDESNEIQEKLEKIASLCHDDQLTLTEAIGRNGWAYECGFISYKDKMQNTHLFDLFDVASFALTTRDSVFYPIFTDGVGMTSNLHTAPVANSAPCELPESVRVTPFLCSSVIVNE